MKKSILALSVVSALGLGGIGAAQAQYVGPSNAKTSTVKDVISSAKDDMHVEMTGKIIKQIGKNKYLFSDGTGEIRLEIDKNVFTKPVDENTKIQIRGEFEKDFMESPEIDVDSIVIK